MRSWIDLCENKTRSISKLIAKATPVFENLIKRNRSKREPLMFRSCEDLVRYLCDLDPTRGEYKYFDWLLRRFSEDPWLELTEGWNNKRSWQRDYTIDRNISLSLTMMERGKITPRDINSFKTLEDLVRSAKTSFSNKKVEPFAPKLIWSAEGNKGSIAVEINGVLAGNFFIDFTHKADGKVSMHSNLYQEFQGKGIGHRIYGWVAAKLKEKGYSLIPSDRLTDRSYNLWKKRAPDLLDGYERHESRSSPTGWLWLSPYHMRMHPDRK